MKVLAIDTATSTATVAVIEDSRLIGEYSINSKKVHSEKLLSIIDDMLAACNMTLSDIDLFACAKGPGSFTGLRIGAATIKGMAQALDKAIVGIPTLDALAYNLCNSTGLICPILDAQQGMVYSALYTRSNDEAAGKNFSLTKLEDFQAIHMLHLIEHLKEKNQPVIFLGDGVYLHREAIAAHFGEAAIASHSLLMPRASSCAFLALERFEENKNESYNSFKPYYIRKSQAEVEYEKKQNIQIREMLRSDVDTVCDIENLSFSTPWSKDAFISEIEKNEMAKYLVADQNGSVVGYGGMWQILDEGHITNIAVHPDCRGRKIGEKIVAAMIAKAQECGIKRLTLEVRTSNAPARKLYENFDFVDYGIRKGYYTDTGEDAIIMWKEI